MISKDELELRGKMKILNAQWVNSTLRPQIRCDTYPEVPRSLCPRSSLSFDLYPKSTTNFGQNPRSTLWSEV